MTYQYFYWQLLDKRVNLRSHTLSQVQALAGQEGQDCLHPSQPSSFSGRQNTAWSFHQSRYWVIIIMNRRDFASPRPYPTYALSNISNWPRCGNGACRHNQEIKYSLAGHGHGKGRVGNVSSWPTSQYTGYRVECCALQWSWWFVVQLEIRVKSEKRSGRKVYFIYAACTSKFKLQWYLTGKSRALSLNGGHLSPV